MSAKDSDKKQWSDPKDYGLPYVEITPLRPKSEPEEVKLETGFAGSVVKAEEDAAVLPNVPTLVVDVPMLAEEEAKPTEATPSLASQKVSTPYSNRQAAEEKSSSWVWMVVLIGLGIVAVIVWQILANRDPQASAPVFEIVDEPATLTPAVVAESSGEITPSDQNQAVVNQDSIPASTISNPNISKAVETGTTIANTASGNLIRIESKTERPQYFIIVGSLPSEKLAIGEASQYFGRSAEIYLIAPYDGGKNYRLALAKFASFKAASEKLEEIKSQYTEELWILKY
jgi:hypothetical protein